MRVYAHICLIRKIMSKLSNRFWFQLHGWFSLPIWVIFCFVCLTGTISVISHELTWLTNSASRASNPDNLLPKTAPELVSVVQKAYPNAKVSTVISFEPYLVNAVIFTDSDKPITIAYVNQYTGDIQEIFSIYAQEAGIVTNRRVSVGDYLKQGEPLFDLMNPEVCVYPSGNFASPCWFILKTNSPLSILTLLP